MTKGQKTLNWVIPTVTGPNCILRSVGVASWWIEAPAATLTSAPASKANPEQMILPQPEELETLNRICPLKFEKSRGARRVAGYRVPG